MFTGIVEETGRIAAVEERAQSIRLSVAARRCGRGVRRGDSVAVNGCCLTVVRRAVRGRDVLLDFDLLRETWDKTNLQYGRPGQRVNLERSLRADGRLGGHFVTGHIDGLGRIVKWEPVGKDYCLEIAAPASLMRTMVAKGSVAVDGISLTLARVTTRQFQIWIIPHTRKVTSLAERRVGDAVNLESDLLGKYVARFLAGNT
jgi:riboflavin synthase